MARVHTTSNCQRTYNSSSICTTPLLPRNRSGRAIMMAAADRSWDVFRLYARSRSFPINTLYSVHSLCSPSRAVPSCESSSSSRLERLGLDLATIDAVGRVETGLDRRDTAATAARLALNKVETRDGVAGETRLRVAAHVARHVLDWGDGHNRETRSSQTNSTVRPHSCARVLRSFLSL